jgi:hypothetical protein
MKLKHVAAQFLFPPLILANIITVGNEIHSDLHRSQCAPVTEQTISECLQVFVWGVYVDYALFVCSQFWTTQIPYKRRVYIKSLLYRVTQPARISVLHAQMRPICQVKLRTPKKRFFPLFLLGRVEISVSFVQNVVENWIEIKFLPWRICYFNT